VAAPVVHSEAAGEPVGMGSDMVEPFEPEWSLGDVVDSMRSVSGEASSASRTPTLRDSAPAPTPPCSPPRSPEGAPHPSPATAPTRGRNSPLDLPGARCRAPPGRPEQALVGSRTRSVRWGRPPAAGVRRGAGRVGGGPGGRPSLPAHRVRVGDRHRTPGSAASPSPPWRPRVTRSRPWPGRSAGRPGVSMGRVGGHQPPAQPDQQLTPARLRREHFRQPTLRRRPGRPSGP
jgi:hypothetical protein